MYRVVWVYRKALSEAPLFYEVPESENYKAAIETVLEKNPGIAVRELDAGKIVTVDKLTFAKEDDYKVYLTKFLEQVPNALVERNRYILENDQELFVRLEENDNTRVVRVVPFLETT